MVARTVRRLPGFRFEARSQPLAESLPRMDVAVLVGFAAAGPLDTPVAVEDAAQFEALFGRNAPLAWNSGRGETQHAHLGPAVRSFFRNGGRRCYIIRVAGDDAKSNHFPVPGLAMASFNEQGVAQIRPAFARARSEGSWSDAVRVSASLLARSTQVSNITQRTDGRLIVEMSSVAASEVKPGDLVRLHFQAEGYLLLISVSKIESLCAGSPPDKSINCVSASQYVWFKTRSSDSPPADADQSVATFFVGDPAQSVVSESSPLQVVNITEEESAGLEPLFHLDLAIRFADAPAPGSMVRVDRGDDQLWMVVEGSSVIEATLSPPGQAVRLSGRGLWFLKEAPSSLPSSRPVAEILTFELWTRQGDEQTARLTDLGFAPQHSRYWAALPEDKELYRDADNPFRESRAEHAFERERVEFWRLDSGQRFPLAGTDFKNVIYIPIGMQATATNYLGPFETEGLPLERDGLARFDASLFLDPGLTSVRTRSLMGQADFLRYLSPAPRKLRGIHAALSIEEATIITAPDAVHRGWSKTKEQPIPEAQDSSPPARPEWWHFLDCDPPPQIPLASEPEQANFLDCGLEVVPAPTLFLETQPDASGTFTLAWVNNITEARYRLQESIRPDFKDSADIFAGRDERLTVYGREPGDYYYRVRAETAGAISNWSNGVGVRISATLGYQVDSEAAYSSSSLLAVHRALLRMCAARGDLTSTLAVPEHYREDAAIEHVRTLKLTPDLIAGTEGVDPLSLDEISDFSYAALYHPWLIGRESEASGAFTRLPPDGAAAGVMAARSIARGAWITPANETLKNVVAITPEISASSRLGIQEAQINLIRQEPRGFLALSEDTLSEDTDLRPLNVRRLLILLRRLALRLGARYVFEPNDDAFRRAVQRGFEAMLGDMFARGAFAGSTPDTSFQVVTDSSLNTPRSVDQGRFIVEIKVAPSLPMTFLTIRLVQTGDRAFVTEGR